MTYRLRFSVGLLLSAFLLYSASCSGDKQDTMAKIHKNKQVVIGTDAVNLPFEFGQGMGVQGYDVDVATEVAKAIGFEIRWVKIPFENLFTSLQKGEVSFVISAISITEERKKTLAFSRPYFSSGQVIVIRREEEKVRTLADLSGKKIGVQAGTTGDQFLKEQRSATNFERKAFATLDDGLLALNNREIDAVIGDYPIVSYSSFTSFPQLTTIGDKLTDESYGIVFRKDDTELVQIANKVIDEMKKSGKSDQLVKTWFEKVENGIKDQKAKEAALARLKVTPKTVVFHLVKDASFTMKFSRLDGYNILLRHKDSGVVATSTAIETNGNNGTCRISVIPGPYSLSMKGYPLPPSDFDVPLVDAMTLNSTMTLGREISITPPK